MPFTSEEAGAAIKGRFGSREHHHRSVEKSVMSPVKSSPNLILKAEIKDSAGIHSSSSSVNRSFVRETGKDQFVQDIDRIPQLSECVREESWQTYICTRPPKSQYAFDYISNQNIPILNEEYFYIWKHGMRVLMDSIDERLFECVSKGPLVPMKVNTDPKTTAKNPFIKKPEQEWTEKDEANASIDGKASYIISRGLETSAYQQVVNCTTAKEMWDAIDEYIDGDDEARAKKLNLYIQQFNNFRKDPKETLRQAYDRFSEIRCNCYALGKEYTNKELNMRFLSGLDKQWFMKTISIEDSKDLNQMTPLSLYSNLRNYEFLINEFRRKEELQDSSRGSRERSSRW